MSYDELLRRALVAAVRRAGTLIREEELKRQALTASVNRPLAEALLKEIDELVKILPDFDSTMRILAERALEDNEHFFDIVLEGFIESYMNSLPLIITGTLDRAESVLVNSNKVIEVANKIIEELSREGIYLSKIEPIKIKDDIDDIFSIARSLRTAKARLQAVVEFFKEIEKYGEKA